MLLLRSCWKASQPTHARSGTSRGQVTGVLAAWTCLTSEEVRIVHSERSVHYAIRGRSNPWPIVTRGRLPFCQEWFLEALTLCPVSP